MKIGNSAVPYPRCWIYLGLDDEVHALLNKHGLVTPLGHLEQAINAHTRGDWAAANGQARSFIESLLDEIAYLLDPNAPRGENQGEARRQLLANLAAPFLSRNLNEWSDDGKSFVNGVFKRLHPQGAHPGLSDEEDSTFRLHLVLLASQLFLRRLDRLVPPRLPTGRSIRVTPFPVAKPIKKVRPVQVAEPAIESEIEQDVVEVQESPSPMDDPNVLAAEGYEDEATELVAYDEELREQQRLEQEQEEELAFAATAGKKED